MAAAVPTTLVLLRKGGPNPLPRNWVLPVYSDHPIKTGDRVEGLADVEVARGDYSEDEAMARAAELVTAAATRLASRVASEAPALVSGGQ